MSANWMKDGLCLQIGPDLFFPKKGDNTRKAKAVCSRCPVMDECLAYAVADRSLVGIWGGTVERERARIRKYQRLEEAA